jgi:oligoendopeptidase F
MKNNNLTAIPNQIPTKVTNSMHDLQEQIRRRAHELYEQRGRDEGHELDDWLQAESEVTRHKAKAVGA